MKTVYLVYVKSSEIELVIAFLTRREAEVCAEMWGKYSAIYELQVKG